MLGAEGAIPAFNPDRTFNAPHRIEDFLQVVLIFYFNQDGAEHRSVSG